MSLSYAELRRRLDQARPQSLRLVHAAEALLRADPEALRPATLRPEVLLAAARLTTEDVPFSPRVWRAWLGNLAMLEGVMRIDRAPYATHPTRMALLCHWVLGATGASADELDTAAVAAILHDYLEEGDGRTPEALATMRRRFPDEPLGVVAAVELSEPILPAESEGSLTDPWSWEKVAYAVQAADAVRRPGGRTLADAALADKLDNLHDLGYLSANPKLAPVRRSTKLAVRFGYFLFIADTVGDAANPAMTALIRDGVAARAEEFAVPRDDVERERGRLGDLRDGQRDVLRRLIADYHRHLGY